MSGQVTFAYQHPKWSSFWIPHISYTSLVYQDILVKKVSQIIFHFVAEHVYCTETRPYNQGARLTAYELVHDKIPATLVCDSMVSALMRARNITAVVVGADRVATNGDTANKIGTYQVLS